MEEEPSGSSSSPEDAPKSDAGTLGGFSLPSLARSAGHATGSEDGEETSKERLRAGTSGFPGTEVMTWRPLPPGAPAELSTAESAGKTKSKKEGFSRTDFFTGEEKPSRPRPRPLPPSAPEYCSASVGAQGDSQIGVLFLCHGGDHHYH
ncbi:hypothetical protein Rs2_23971 [Raphanus sativus]|nr:hypothetical protein Rs2_23971 [Raphanus sativus]